MDNPEQGLNRRLQAIADPTRRRILAALKERGGCSIGKDVGLQVSVDSVDIDELLRGGRAGADYLLSLTLDTLWVADEVASTSEDR